MNFFKNFFSMQVFFVRILIIFSDITMGVLEYSAMILKNEHIAKETRGVLARVENENFLFSPGQFLSVKIQERIFRAYSIASAPSSLPEFSLCIKILQNGMGSQYIDSLSEGDKIVFRGPFGHFGIKQPEKKTLCIATGTGIAPMKSIFESQLNATQKKDLELLFGVREEEHASYLEDFQKAQQEHSFFSFTLCVSRPPFEGEFFVGRVTDFLRKQSKDFFSGKEILVCGNPPMVKEVKEILEEKEVEKQNIVSESF
jgi:NAD(P)H-flavin reductase